MQFYANKKWLPLKTILFFAAVLFIAYLPVSSFLFFIKNDAFTGYFPPKYFMSESLHAGHLPLWNPYINFGIPQYGDMSSGYWSPITWLIASTVGYSAYSFTLELLLYILIGAAGMYKLTGSFSLSRPVRIVAAVAFMCCGYNISHLQHFNWLSGAAFLPWCFWSYRLLLEQGSPKNIVQAVLLFYMLAASAHPGITISACYFFTAFFIFHCFFGYRQNRLFSFKAVLRSHAAFLLLFTIVAAGMIAGYLDIFPYFARGEKISLEDSLLNPTTIQSWISILFPFATVKNNAFFETDASMRNSYFSLLLLLFFLASLFTRKTKSQNFLLITGLCFLLLSTGGMIKTIAYKFLPFIGYVRLNGEFRLFAIFCFILEAAIELDQFIRLKKGFDRVIKRVYQVTELLIFFAIAFGLYKSFSSGQNIFQQLGNVAQAAGISAKLKLLIDGISFYDCIWIQGFVQLFLIGGIKWCLRMHRYRALVKIVVLDLVIASLLNIPFTGVGKASVADVQQLINQAPRGIPVPKLVPINQVAPSPAGAKQMIGDWSFYNKQPGVSTAAAYPIVLKNTAAYFDRVAAGKAISVSHLPLLFCTDSDNAHFGKTDSCELVINAFSPNKISLTIEKDAGGAVVYLQNFYPHWFYYDGTQKYAVLPAGLSFMKAPVAKEGGQLSFSFEPLLVKCMMLLSLIAITVSCIFLVMIDIRSTFLSSRQRSPYP